MMTEDAPDLNAAADRRRERRAQPAATLAGRDPVDPPAPVPAAPPASASPDSPQLHAYVQHIFRVLPVHNEILMRLYEQVPGNKQRAFRWMLDNLVAPYLDGRWKLPDTPRDPDRS